MVNAIYGIYDKRAEQYNGLLMLNRKTAPRTFAWMAKEKKPAECEDIVIMDMGDFDHDYGTFALKKPEEVYDLQAAKEALLNAT